MNLLLGADFIIPGDYMTFKKWLRSITMIVSNEEQVIIEDVFLSDGFPDSVEKYVMLDYLKSSLPQQVNLFRSLYKDYIRFISRETLNS